MTGWTFSIDIFNAWYITIGSTRENYPCWCSLRRSWNNNLWRVRLTNWFEKFQISSFSFCFDRTSIDDVDRLHRKTNDDDDNNNNNKARERRRVVFAPVNIIISCFRQHRICARDFVQLRFEESPRVTCCAFFRFLYILTTEKKPFLRFFVVSLWFSPFFLLARFPLYAHMCVCVCVLCFIFSCKKRETERKGESEHCLLVRLRVFAASLLSLSLSLFLSNYHHTSRRLLLLLLLLLTLIIEIFSFILSIRNDFGKENFFHPNDNESIPQHIFFPSYTEGLIWTLKTYLSLSFILSAQARTYILFASFFFFFSRISTRRKRREI